MKGREKVLKRQRKSFARIAVIFMSVILILTSGIPNYFAYATGEQYTEAQIAEANKALDDF